jgi:hypothetical protein
LLDVINNKSCTLFLMDNSTKTIIIATLLWEECEDETNTPKMGTWESIGTPKTLEFNCRGQNTSYWGVLYIIGKLSKGRCRKWARMSHLDICSTSYDKKKGRESAQVPSSLMTLPNIHVLMFAYCFHIKLEHVCLEILGNKKLPTLVECSDSFFRKINNSINKRFF